jgi:hypothetical protein
LTTERCSSVPTVTACCARTAARPASRRPSIAMSSTASATTIRIENTPLIASVRAVRLWRSPDTA